jgi:hypothetical protein
MQRTENMSSSLPCYNVQDSNEKESDLVNIVNTRNQKEKDNWTIWPAGHTRKRRRHRTHSSMEETRD